MGFLRTEWHLFLKDKLAKDHYKVASTYAVMVAGSAALQTIYSEVNATSAVTDRASSGTSSGEIRFWTDASVTSVDVTIYTANGEAIYIKGVTPSVHGIWIDRQKLTHHLVVPVAFNNNSETDMEFTVVAGTLIEDIMLSVETIDATETIDVGLDGSTTNDPNGLIAAASIATAGYVELGGAVNNGGTSDYFDSVVYGALLASFINGSDGAATSGGVVRNKVLIGATETDANITVTCSAGSDTFIGFIVLTLTKLPL
jgi:hypothetical protein